MPSAGDRPTTIPLDNAHHDGSELYVPDGTPSLGDTVPVRVRVPAGASASFYHWTDADPGYVGWLGHASLPKLDHRRPRSPAG